MICIVFDAALSLYNSCVDDVRGVHTFSNQPIAWCLPTYLFSIFNKRFLNLWNYFQRVRPSVRPSSILEHNYRRWPAWLHPWSISSFKLPRRYVVYILCIPSKQQQGHLIFEEKMKCNIALIILWLLYYHFTY